MIPGRGTAQRRNRRRQLSRHGHDRARPCPRDGEEGADAGAGEARQTDGRLRRALREPRVDGRPCSSKPLSRASAGRSDDALSAGTMLGTCARCSPRCSAPRSRRPRTGSKRRRAARATRAQGAFIDLTGQWVSVITEDWRWRMVTPPKGDTASVPLNPAGRKVADAWDLAADRARGDLCKAFGPPSIDPPAGTAADPVGERQHAAARVRRRTQTRRFHFGRPAPAGGAIAAGAFAGAVVPAAAESRHLRPRRRGAPAARSRS